MSKRMNNPYDLNEVADRMKRPTILGKDNEPLTDTEVDLCLKTAPPSDPETLARIKAKFDALQSEKERIAPKETP